MLTNHHEPEEEIEAGEFTFAQFRAANARLNRRLDAQNARDGETRKVSVILMISTYTGYKGRNAENYWPTSSKGDAGTVDFISADVYALPHGTATAVPTGYTTGSIGGHRPNLMLPVLNFAKAHATDWAVSELGYLEDVNDPMRTSQAIRDAVAFARAGKPTATNDVPAGAVDLLLGLPRLPRRLAVAVRQPAGPVDIADQQRRTDLARTSPDDRTRSPQP